MPEIRNYVEKLKKAKTDFEECQRLCGETKRGEIYELGDIKTHWRFAYEDVCNACQNSSQSPDLQSYTQLWNNFRLDILKNSLMVEKQVSVLNFFWEFIQ